VADARRRARVAPPRSADDPHSRDRSGAGSHAEDHGGGLSAEIVQRYTDARRDRGLVVLEGFQPVKHAARFGAEILEIASVDADRFDRLAAELAPDLPGLLREPPIVVDSATFARLAPAAPRTGVIGIARRPAGAFAAAIEKDAPVVFLERPTRLENIGMSIRVAAAAGAAALITTGDHDPWHPSAVRTGVGLQFALEVAHSDGTAAVLDLLRRAGEQTRPIIALDPDGEPLARTTALPRRAVLAFGHERAGLSNALLDAAHHVVRIPMRDGVSSLNLATAVAVALYSVE
jgi:TrmH family RNA methyltransferase